MEYTKSPFALLKLVKDYFASPDLLPQYCLRQVNELKQPTKYSEMVANCKVIAGLIQPFRFLGQLSPGSYEDKRFTGS